MTGTQETGRGMRIYWTCWLAVTIVVSAFGAVVGLLALSTVGLLGIVAVGTAFTYVGIHVVTRAPARFTQVRWLVQAGLVGVGGCLSLFGLSEFMGLSGPVLMALLATTSPPAAHACRAGARAVSRVLAPETQTLPRTGGESQVPAIPDRCDTPPHGPTARSLTDAQLCLAWRRSFIALQSSRDLYHQTRLVDIRQEYLDELERRNPRGFARWLYAGARPASDPSRYVLAVEKDQDPHPHRPAVTRRSTSTT